MQNAQVGDGDSKEKTVSWRKFRKKRIVEHIRILKMELCRGTYMQKKN